MGRLLLLLFLLYSLSIYSQEVDKVSFSEAVELNIKEYTKKSDIAYYYRDYERGEFLFDSIINNVIKGSYLDNFTVRKRSGRKIELNKFKKPIVLITYATWHTPGKGEIPALNKIAKKHHKEIDFVVLFWDTKKNVRRATRKYSRKINILYVDELENKFDHIVKTMKHSFGMPTTFFIDHDKRIIDVRRTAIHHYSEEFETSFNINYTSFLDGVSLLKLDSQKIVGE